jgi:hypothetical protein
VSPHRGYVFDLVADMVEVENGKVRLATVNTSTLEKNVPNPLLEFAVTLLPIATDSWHLEDTVLRPPFAVVVTLARAADVMACAAVARSVGKLGVRLFEVTHAASPRFPRAKFKLNWTILRLRAIRRDRESRRELSVATLCCCLAVMAVGATHDAFRDLSFDTSPTRAPRDHHREVERLVS